MRDALTAGTVTEDHVDALANALAHTTDDTRQRVLSQQRQLVRNASRLSPEKFYKYCREHVLKEEHDQGEDRSDQQQRRTSLRSWIDAATGMRRIAGEFDPETGSRIWNAIQIEIGKAIIDDEGNRLVDRDRLAAEALERLVSGGHANHRPNRADIAVHIDLLTLLSGLHEAGICELSDGTPITAETARRLACDANIIPMVFGSSGVALDMGRRARLATDYQRHALRAIHSTCSFPRCDVPFDRCEIHHILDWNHNGFTDLDNLTPLCSRHHHLLHEGGWKARFTDDHVLEVWEPGAAAPADAISQAKAGPPGDHGDSPPGGRPPDPARGTRAGPPDRRSDSGPPDDDARSEPPPDRPSRTRGDTRTGPRRTDHTPWDSESSLHQESLFTTTS